LIFVTVSHCVFQAHNPPASASQVLGFQAFTIIPDSKFFSPLPHPLPSHGSQWEEEESCKVLQGSGGGLQIMVFVTHTKATRKS
jgi:hypothetical protein